MAKRSRRFKCGACESGFNSLDGARQHVESVHRKKLANGGSVCIWQIAEIVAGDDEPSFADRAVDAEIARACGEPTDDAWLLGEG